MKIKYKRYS